MTTITPTATQVYQLYIRATPEQVWQAITDPEMASKYFFGAQVEPGPIEVGAHRRSWSPDHTQLWGDHEILECDPPRRLVHTWKSLYDEELVAEDESRVAWEIEPADGGLTKLTLVHDKLENSPRTAESVTGWTYILSGLKSLVETGQGFTG